MTVSAMLAYVDEMKPNGVETSTKKKWLADVEAMVYEEILLTHVHEEGLEFDGFDSDNDELTLKPPHEDVYRFYLESQIDLVNMELAKYNNSKALFNSAWLNASSAYNRTHTPLGAKHIDFGRRRPAWDIFRN